MLVTIVITTLVTIGVTTYHPTRFERVTRGCNRISRVIIGLIIYKIYHLPILNYYGVLHALFLGGLSLVFLKKANSLYYLSLFF